MTCPEATPTGTASKTENPNVIHHEHGRGYVLARFEDGTAFVEFQHADLRIPADELQGTPAGEA